MLYFLKIKVMVVLNVIPMGRPRETISDRWKRRPCIVNYREVYKDGLRKELERTGFKVTEVLPPITFVIPMPPSWPKKKTASLDGQPHKENTPDLDNLIKAFLDCVFDKESIANYNFSDLKNDKEVHTFLGARKIWGEAGQIILG